MKRLLLGIAIHLLTILSLFATAAAIIALSGRSMDGTDERFVEAILASAQWFISMTILPICLWGISSLFHLPLGVRIINQGQRVKLWTFVADGVCNSLLVIALALVIPLKTEYGDPALPAVPSGRDLIIFGLVILGAALIMQAVFRPQGVSAAETPSIDGHRRRWLWPVICLVGLLSVLIGAIAWFKGRPTPANLEPLARASLIKTTSNPPYCLRAPIGSGPDAQGSGDTTQGSDIGVGTNKFQ